MKSNEEFKAFYETSLLPTMMVLEEDRKRIIRKMKPFLFIFLFFLIITVGSLVSSNQMHNPDDYSSDNELAQFLAIVGVGALGCSLLILIIYGLVFSFSLSKKIKDLKYRFKGDVISKMVKFVDESLHYEHQRGISHGEYQQSKIFVTNVDRYHSEDMVSGKLGSTAIRFSEVHSERKVERSNGEGKQTEWKTIFKGILFAADFNKNFVGRTVVVTDVAENILGGFGTMFQKMNTARDPLIKLEDVDFENEFAVYGTDPVEAHYILSPSLMKRIVEFRKKSGLINLSFIDSHVYIAIPVRAGLNLFEPKIYSTLINYERIAGYNKYLMLVTGIVEDLNLNTRIWTKA